jgi:Bacterial Ig domain
MSRTIYVIATLVAALILSSCNQRAADLAPDQVPQVSIATINGVDARFPVGGKIYVPSASIYPVEVKVTASDETLVSKVELFLNNQSVGILEPKTVNGTPTDFTNPFKFTVNGLTGVAGQLTPATLRTVATDNRGQPNEYEIKVLVDSTPPVVEITSITGLAGAKPDSFDGSVIVSGNAFDPESGVRFDTLSGLLDVVAYLDGDKSKVLNLSSDTKIPQTVFVTTVKELEDGAHFVTVEAHNGANVFVSSVKTFNISKPK